MRRSPWRKLWFLLFVTALAVGGGLTLAVWQSSAADPPLWTESQQSIPSGNPPLPPSSIPVNFTRGTWESRFTRVAFQFKTIPHNPCIRNSDPHLQPCP